jgi:hypothetical protein
VAVVVAAASWSASAAMAYGASNVAPSARMDKSDARNFFALTASRRNLFDALDTAMPPLYRNYFQLINSETDC